ncbi:NmrA/HSCARG family protein [Nocardia sp. NPDC056000]|uniref:NmrA/HSCARG family protein n=1 Tax=Nocardia sp. NPDC056000 TaxID=3345674 RepID=UPI0035DA4F9F
MAEQREEVILVTGATGNQGGAAATRLLRAGWRVRALTRDPMSTRAKALVSAGCEIVAGEQSDRTALDIAMRGVHGVFSVQPGALAASPVPYDEEIAWGRKVADAASNAGVAHLVYASVAGAQDSAGIAVFEPKLRIERYIKEIGVPATILRPVSFMENYADAWTDSQALATPLDPAVPEQLIALADIGAFVAFAFGDPGRYLGRTVTIAGDQLTPPEIARALSAAAGRTVDFVQIPIDAVRAGHGDFADVVEFLNRRGGYRASIAETRELHPAALTFERWLTARHSADA